MGKEDVTIKFITDMKSHGSDKNVDEFRITELKALMRTTLRELYICKGNEVKKESGFNKTKLSESNELNVLNIKIIEDILFGSMKRKSLISLKTDINLENKNSYNITMMVPQKYNDFLDIYMRILLQASIIGAVGSKSRKGRGSFVIIYGDESKYDEMINRVNNPIELVETLGKTIADDINGLINGIINKKEYTDIKVCLRSSNNDLDLEEQKWDFPYVKSLKSYRFESVNKSNQVCGVMGKYLDVTKGIDKLTKQRCKPEFYKKYEKNHRSNVISVQINILGNYKIKDTEKSTSKCNKKYINVNRFACPIFVTFWENKNGKYIIIKELNYKYMLRHMYSREYGNEEQSDKKTKYIRINEAYVNKYISELTKMEGIKFNG